MNTGINHRFYPAIRGYPLKLTVGGLLARRAAICGLNR